jgi:hypothetical protein
MNLAANMLGLGNAATPFGLKAMVELDRLNPHRGSATNAMALFLAINATSITLMPPTGTVMIRAAAGSAAPFSIWIPTLIATTASTLTAVLVCLAVQRLAFFRPRPPADGAGGGRDLPEAVLLGSTPRRRAGPGGGAVPPSASPCRRLAVQWAEQAPALGTGPSCATRCSGTGCRRCS